MVMCMMRAVVTKTSPTTAAPAPCMAEATFGAMPVRK